MRFQDYPDDKCWNLISVRVFKYEKYGSFSRFRNIFNFILILAAEVNFLLNVKVNLNDCEVGWFELYITFLSVSILKSVYIVYPITSVILQIIILNMGISCFSKQDKAYGTPEPFKQAFRIMIAHLIITLVISNAAEVDSLGFIGKAELLFVN